MRKVLASKTSLKLEEKMLKCKTNLLNYYKILFREIKRFNKKCENYFTKLLNFSK